MAIANLAKKRRITNLELIKPVGGVLLASKINLQPKLQIRQAKMSDLDAVVQLDHEVWKEDVWATKEMYKSRFKTFKEGIFIAVEGEKIVGVGVTEIMNYNLEKPITTWKEVSDDGYMKKSHNPQGDSLYGVSLSVSPFAPKRTALLIIETAKIFCVKKGLKSLILGSRIPKYYKYVDKMSVEEYIEKITKAGRPFDPEIAFYKKRGFEIVKILPEYFDDPESKNYGVLVIWRNLYYGKSFLQWWDFLIKINFKNLIPEKRGYVW